MPGKEVHQYQHQHEGILTTMARFAPVVPVHMAASLQNGSQQRDYLGEYHLLLAHDVIDKPDQYREIYGKVRTDYVSHSFIIMDNSIVELGKAMEIADLLRACQILRPDCLVIPDVMGEGEETRIKARSFVREYCQKALELESKGWEAPPLLGVIQGEDVEDALETYMLYYSLPLVDYISVPRIITKQHGSRMPLLLAMQRQQGTLRSFQGLHLLGFSDNILDDVACARMPFVKGIDSAVPIRAGLGNIRMDLNDVEWSKMVGPRGSFWEQPCDTGWDMCLPCIQTNLTTYRRWIKT